MKAAIAVIGILAVGCIASCASQSSQTAAGKGRSVFPVVTTSAPAKEPEALYGWQVVRRPRSREQMAELLDPGRHPRNREFIEARQARQLSFKLGRDPGGTWSVSETGELRDPNVEEIWVDLQEAEVGLLTDKANLSCRVVDPAQRRSAGYSVCTSNFAAPNAPANGDYWVNVNGYALVEAIKQARLFPQLEERSKIARQAKQDAINEKYYRRLADERAAALALAKARADFWAASEVFRRSLSAGAETHCGMVIELKKPLVSVQTMEGQKWFRIEQIFPPSSMPCRFVNHMYQDP